MGNDNFLGAGLNYEYQTLSATLTLTVNNFPIQFVDPNGANRIVKLPTTSIIKGQPFRIVNVDPTYSITLQASDASQIAVPFIDAMIDVHSKQATPTSNAHWKIDKAQSNYLAHEYQCGDLLTGSNRLAFSIEYSASVGTYRTTGGYCKVTPYRTFSGDWRMKIQGYAEFPATNDIVYFKLWGNHTQTTAWVANGETVSTVGMTSKSGIVQFGMTQYCDQNNFASGSIGTRDYLKIASASTYLEGNSSVASYVSGFFNIDFTLNAKPAWLLF